MNVFTTWTLLFFAYAAIVLAGAVGVLLAQGVFRMASWLILSLAGVAGMMLLWGADFLGAAQLLVYVGGTAVLLVFGIMLTMRSDEETYQIPRTERLAIYLGSALVGVLLVAMLRHVPWDSLAFATAEVSAEALAERDNRPAETTAKLGQALVGLPPEPGRSGLGYLLPFEIVSVHLLVVLVGAAHLARVRSEEEVERAAVVAGAANPEASA